MNFSEHATNNSMLSGSADPAIAKLLPQFPITVVSYEDGMQAVWSFWRPTPEELAALNAGAAVVLAIAGLDHPPVTLGVDGVDWAQLQMYTKQ